MLCINGNSDHREAAFEEPRTYAGEALAQWARRSTTSTDALTAAVLQCRFVQGACDQAQVLEQNRVVVAAKACLGGVAQIDSN